MFYKMLGLFMYMLIGFFIRKKNIIEDAHTKGLSIFLMDVSLPAITIAALQMPVTHEKLIDSLWVLLVGLLSYAVMGFIAFLTIKIFPIPKEKRKVVIFMLLFANTAFAGYPVIHSLFGEAGLFDAVILNFWFTVFLWTVGVQLLSGGEEKFHWKKLFNPGMISLVIGFLFFILGIKIPLILYEPLKALGDTTIPLAMCLVGALLSETKIRNVLKDKVHFLVAFLRLIFIPLAYGLLLKLFHLPLNTFITAVLITSMPIAANTAIFARRFELDYTFASEGILLTTLLSLVTIPLWVYVLPFLY